MSNKHQLRETIIGMLQQHFTNLEGESATNLYNLFMQQVEPPLLEAVMLQANRNQSKAAKWLGLSRNTLRKLLAKYKLD